MAPLKQAADELTAMRTVLQEIRDAVILQNCIAAIAEANRSNVDVDNVLAAARGYATPPRWTTWRKMPR